MIKGIVGYTAQKQGKSVLLERAYGTFTDTLLAETWEDAAKFLTEDKGDAFHVTWELPTFTNTILSLVPAKERDELQTKTTIFVGDSKIFYVDVWLGITLTVPLQGNFVEKHENNLFGLVQFMPPNTDAPANAKEVAEYGEQVIAGYERMAMYPDKLTSSVGVVASELSNYKLPTTSTNEAIIDACGYCIQMMDFEWWSAYKLGYFKQVYSYDMVSAYPSIIFNLPNTNKCAIEYRDTYIHSDWAIVKGEINVTADISPFVYETEEGNINPKGKWVGYFTKEEINWLIKHEAGTFKLIDGYFINWLSKDKPYREPINKLFNLRLQSDAMVNNLSKRAAQGISGKLSQQNKDGKLGELYNPILAAMTRSRCRLAVADFVYDNDLLSDILAIQVDSCESLKEVVVDNNGSMGSWRLDSVSPELILSRNDVWKPDKKPEMLTMTEVIDALEAHPSLSSYDIDGVKIDFGGRELKNDRIYRRYPRTGKEALTLISESTPIEI